MNPQDHDTSRDTKPKREQRDEHLSKDGKWRSFPKVPNLLQYVSTGTYFARVKVNGKIFRESLATTVFTHARLRLLDFVKDAKARRPANDTPVLFKQARALYEQHLDADHGIADNSKRYRRYCIKALLASWPELDQMKLAKVTGSDCRDWASRFSKKVDAQYFNNVLGTFRAILREGGISSDFDPLREVKRIGVKPPQLILPEPSQFEKLLHEIDTSGAGQAHHCADLVRFLAFSGCRLSEARNVLWKDIDLERGHMWIRSAKVRKTSGARESRVVPIIPPMRDLLLKLKAQQNSAPFDRVCVLGECEKSLTRACHRVGVARITHHDLRHLFATRCIESGVDIPTIARWLGHQDGGVLAMRIYGHLRQDHSLAMAQKVTFAR